MSQQELIDAVLYERRIELAYEGKRFWDLLRRKIFSICKDILVTELKYK